MSRRVWIWMLACLLVLAGAWLFWRQPVNSRAKPAALPAIVATTARSASAMTNLLSAVSTNVSASAKTNPFPWRLSNTSKSIGQLTGDRHAILLENAFIDTGEPLNLSIPAHLRSLGDPGAYIVQARGPIGVAFRAMLARSGAEIVAYIPNDAYLIRAPAIMANGLAADPLTQAVIPYEPYYKISSSIPVLVGPRSFSAASAETNPAARLTLLDLAVKQAPLPSGTFLTLGLFKDDSAATVTQIEKLGGTVLAQSRSPFGPVVRVQPPANWIALAALPGVQIVEPLSQRRHANDLSRVTTSVATDTLVASNYMNLTGSNVLVEVNDSGVDAAHPDFQTGSGAPIRVTGDFPISLVDTNGHGTHVAGIIAGNGQESTTVIDAQGSILTFGGTPGTGTNGQFRGKAPLADLFSVAFDNTFSSDDQYLQEEPALTNALISNNSWNYSDAAYDLAAASYDAAVRDALPEVTGSQPVLFVFAAGNAGGGGNDGSGGGADTILSPATAKNVITVGALEQLRGITNQVTNADGTVSTPWQPETDSSYQVAWYSSRGNVGVGTEGGTGRFKPDVVAPGSFVISTRSEQWDEKAYYNPTNYNFSLLDDQVSSGSENFYSLLVPSNAVQITIQLFPDLTSPSPFPDLPIWLWQGTDPRVSPPNLVKTDSIFAPPDVPLAPVGAGWQYAVSNNTSMDLTYFLLVDIITTNANGNYFQVLSNLNDSIDGFKPPHWYRYESGTSMSAADVSGVLALMQDYFTNTLHATPSPALLKALLINGSRPDGNYSYGLQNSLNFEGWGLVNLTNTLPAGITNVNTPVGESMIFMDQSPTNALATGDSQTYFVGIPDGSDGQLLPLQVTLAWTDPPGDPAAAIKLVNSLELVVTNLDTGDVFFGNDIASGDTFNLPWDTNTPPNIDTINNVQNVFLGALLSSKYSVTVIGRNVNVNAVTAQTNTYAVNGPPGTYAPNVVQDYALVISIGEGEVTNAFTITNSPIVSNPTADQQISYIISTNAPVLNQLVGASSPLLGTNQVPVGTISVLNTNNLPMAIVPGFGTNAIVTIGMTNQWHFYVVTNNGASDFTNAGFITFFPPTLSIPRMGVFAGTLANATRPEADIDLYVTRDPTLLPLNPAAISNCVHGTQVGLSVAGVFNGASLGRGGTEYVVDIHSQPGAVYYIGVYSEDQEASEYDFIPIFTDIPFSQPGPNGSQIVNGTPIPVNIPDGSPAHPGISYIFGLALYPEQVLQVVVTNGIQHQNYGDLIGTFSHGSGNGISQTVVLNNHDSLGNTFGAPPVVYDDSGFGNTIGSRSSDGPGSLNSYVGNQGNGVWLLTEVDDSQTQTGRIANFHMLIVPHQDLQGGVNGTVPPLSWFYDFIDVPSGTTSLTISATNLTASPQLLDLYVKLGSIPTLTDTNEFGPAGLTNGIPPGNSITINSPAPGRYWVGLYNTSVQPQAFFLIASLGIVKTPGEVIYTSGGNVPLLDDAVTTDTILVPANQTISSMEVGLRVDHPRVSDLVFHLISPSGTRVLLVENRGGYTTEGMGATINVTNIVPVTSSGGAAASSSIINVAIDTGTLAIFYNFYTLPDEMVIHDQSGALIFDSGLISGSGVFNAGYTNSTYLTIAMNPFGNSGGSGDLWDYTVNALQSKVSYLVLTEDTNKTITPIKFAPPPFAPDIVLTTNPPAMHSSFEGSGNVGGFTGTYDGWHVDAGNIDIYSTGTPPPSPGSAADEGTNYIDIDGSGGNPAATISTNIATVPGMNYTLSFTYSRNPDGSPPATVQALQNGNPLLTVTHNKANSWTSLGWATTNVVFTATSNLTKITFQSLDASSDNFGVLLDAIDLTGSTLNDGFENTTATNYVWNINPGFGGWQVVTNQVTVISNSVLAKTGTNLLALANAQIYRSLPTTPGTKYTLSFAYRGPGAVGLWRGESNAVDDVSANDGTFIGGKTNFAVGEVGHAFAFDGSSNYVSIPDSPFLDSFTSSITIDLWMKVNGPPVNPDWRGIVTKGNNSWRLEGTSRANTVTFAADGGSNPFLIGTRNVNDGQWHHVAGVYDGAHMFLYVDGTLDVSVPATSLISQNNDPLCIGANAEAFIPSCSCNGPGYFFNGLEDEVTIYSRALSPSEINAIYQNGTAGKYNTNAPAGIAQGLAEAQMTLNDTNQPIIFGNDTNWQTATYSFVATSTNTPLLLTGIEPGMLLDNFVMTSISTNNYDLYYQPEQSLDTVKGENAFGPWQLEVQDDRAGASNPAPSLVSWQLRFNFPFTPPTITTLTNTQVITNNVIPPGGIEYYLVIVPTNADISTNFLLNTTGPLNLIFDAANPPTSIIPPDYLLLANVVGNASTNLTTVSAPNFAAGGTYYLGVQNLSGVPETYDIQVFFHLLSPLVLPQLPELLAIATQPFVVTNSATGGFPPYTNALTSSVTSVPAPIIDPLTAVITWTPIGSQAPAVYTLTNIVTDSAGQMATDIFHVLVVLTNGLPAFPGAEGAGGFAIGGRGGDVYHVINVNDSGPGSLRFGIEGTFGSRTIVFDVSGTINLISPLKIANPYFTIAGQTAPGDGITIQGLTFSAESAQHTVESSHDEILRYLRCRPGDIYSPYFQGDSFHFNQVTNSIADHLSASWSINTVLSTMYSTNVTVQWSMIAESLNHSAHYLDNGSPGFQENGDGSLIRYGSGAISYHHNLYADNFSQNPRVGDNIRLDFINNVVCNWGGAVGTNANDAADNPAGYTNNLNYRGNYFIAGNNTTANPNIAFASGVLGATNTQIYEATNLIDNNPAGGLAGIDTAFGMFSGPLTQLASPTPMPEIGVITNSPALAYEQVLAFAGASVAGATAAGTPAYGTSLLRDPVDTNIVINVRNKSGQIIDFISPTNFPGVYFITNSGTTYSNYTGAGSYWVSQGVTNFVGVNPWPVLGSAPQPVDTDGDGLPDYWEMTLLATGQASMNETVPNNNHSNPDGYTDLEEYLNWLASPHALTVSNTPVDVDLYAIVGRTGSLIFSVTNGTNGTVTLGSDGHTATFMPGSTNIGFASFGFTVTNLATSMSGTNLDNGFDVTVSVMVSVTNIVTSSLPLTNAIPQTNTVAAGGIVYYLIDVPVNAQLATNILSNVSGGTLNLIYSQAGFPTGTNTGDYFLMNNSAGGISLLSTNSTPTNIVPGGTYYLGVQNTGGTPVSFNIEVDFYPPPPVPPVPVQPVNISSITATNFGLTNGFLIQWYAPTNDLFRLRWTANIGAPTTWNLFTNLISYTGPLTTTNGLFSFFDDGSQTGGILGPQRFYQLLLVQSANLLALPFQPNVTVSPLTPLVVTNTATDSNTNALLNYVLTTSPTNGATISSNGIINWTSSASGTYTFMTVVTDNGVPPAAATNSFTVTIGGPLVISGVTMTTNGQFRLQWSAPNTYQFQVEWTTNLASSVWTLVPPGPPYITSASTSFTFMDTNAAVRMKFYRLIQKFP